VQALLPRPTAANLRRFAEMPVARRAINIVKDRIASMDWQVRLKRGFNASQVENADAKLAALRAGMEEPNATDSFRTLCEQVLEDLLVGGFGAIEMEDTGNEARPFQLWPVDGATVQINLKWDGSADAPRYAQATGKIGTGALIPFETINQFLSAHRYAGRLASNSVVQYALWLNETTPTQHERMIRWWQDEIEGTGRVPILSCEEKPEVLRFAGGTDADLRLEWQEFLLRMIANAFDLPAMMLGVQSDVNKSTASELADEAFSSAIVPTAKLFAEHITRDLFAKKLGWREFEFVFNDLEARDESEEVQIQTELLKAGVLTVDEVRAMRGLGPLGAARTADCLLREPSQQEEQ